MKSAAGETKAKKGWPDSPVFWERIPAFPRLASTFLLIGASGFLTGLLFVAPEQLRTVRGMGSSFLALMAASAWLLVSHGKVQAASFLLIFGSWTYVTVISFFTGGLHANPVFIYPLIIMMAGWRLGPGFGYWLAGFTVAACLGFYLAESMGVLPPSPPNPLALPLIVQFFAVVFSAVLVNALVRSYRARLDEVSVLSDKLAQRTAELQTREVDLNRAQSVAHIGSWTYDISGDALHLSAESCRIFGVPEETEGSYQKFLERVHPDDRAMVARTWQAAVEGGKPFDIEHRIVVGQAIRWLRQIAELESDPEGKPWRALGTTQDITERKEMEEAMRTNEERSSKLASMLRLMCDNVPDMIWAKGLDKRYLFANKALCEQLLNATDTEEPLGKTDLFFAHRERDSRAEDPQWHTFGELCQDTDTITLDVGKPLVFEEFGNVRGKLLFLDVHKAPFLDEQGEVIGTVGSARDITARKQSESELDEHRNHLEELVEQRTTELLATEARASRILESTADGLYGVDSESRITFINPAACRMFGYTAEQVIGRRAHALFHHSRLDGSPYPAEECASRQAWRAGRESRVDDETYWHADGHPVPVALATHPIIESGVIVGAVVSIVDISIQRAAAQAREQALAAAENLAQARSEFLANMSHEIRTPMNGVLGFAHIGQRNYKDPEKARNAFDKILASGNQLLAVVNEILDFSKIEAGQLKIEAVDMSLVDAIDQSLELVADRARAKGLDLRLETASDFPLRCVSDPIRTGQVLLNLLSNAVKFTELGSIVLSASRQGDELVFRVTDTGIGISPEQLGYVFNPFQQADGSTTRKFGGTGLGLAISKRLLELMQGHISVESTPGVGSRFEFRLPYVQPAAPSATPAPAPTAEVALPDKPLAGISIMVAEDDEINQMVLEFNLVEDGARLVIVGNGLEAVERIVSDGPDAYDIVLMDIQMPEMDGYEAARRILELAPDLAIVGQTANAFAIDRDKCLAAGMVGHIAKPIDPQALVQLVLQIVAAKRSN